MGQRWYRKKEDPQKKTNETFSSVCQYLRQGGFVPIPLEGKTPIPIGWAGFWLNPPSEKTYAK